MADVGGGPPELDADQIQNMINMSLANAYDTVSSWLAPQSEEKERADAKLKADQLEFERLAFRAPRLGVGATQPAATTDRDTHKLWTKLGASRHSREESSSTNGRYKVIDSDDEEKSKAQSVLSKKSKATNGLLPTFEPVVGKNNKKKKRKKKHNQDETTAPTQDIANGKYIAPEEEEWGGVGSESDSDSNSDHDMPPPPPPVHQTVGPKGLDFKVTGSTTTRFNPSSTHTFTSVNETPKSTVSPASSITSSHRNSQSPAISINGTPGQPQVPSGKKRKRKRKKKRHAESHPELVYTVTLPRKNVKTNE